MARDDTAGPRRFTRELARHWIHTPTADDDKYRRGVVGLRTGSAQYPGAAVLSTTAAWRGGAGMVRYEAVAGTGDDDFGLPAPAAAVLAARPETVFGAGHSDAWVVGSGTGERTLEATAELTRLLDEAAPVVLDAGALDLVRPCRAPLVVTPHWGEFRRLWQHAGLSAWPGEEATPPNLATRSTAALRLAHKCDAVVLLKGSDTAVAAPSGELWVVTGTSPFLATAGTGDVLGGLLGALLATAVKHRDSLTPAQFAEIAATAATVHSRAAEIASGSASTWAAAPEPDPHHALPMDTVHHVRPRPHTITALDVAEALPAALAELAGERTPGGVLT